MKAIILYLLLLGALSSIAVCGVAPEVGTGLNEACTTNCNGLQQGDDCGNNCTCVSNDRHNQILVCLPRGARRPYDFGGN
uniref:Mucin n=1 Tax=Rhipicephalus zambeziensis TaxID=60191 RepID=A0A224YD51_9ACAR